MNHSPFFSIFCSILCLSVLLKISLAIDILAQNQSINDGQTLVSPGERFEFGLFSPGRSKAKYLGIWYKATPDVVVWVANRNNSLTDSRGVLTLSSNGTLTLLSSTRSIVWSSNASRIASSPVVVQLLDTGNLVLRDNTSADVLWQSFDYPSDTRLPGMLMGENAETGREQYLTSWRSADDPSNGEFTYIIEHDDLSQLVLKTGTGIRFRTGPWNGMRFNGLLLFGDRGYDTTYDYNRNRVVSVSDPTNSSAITRVIVNESGLIQRYVLDEQKNEWHLSYTIPDNPCDYYGHCGPNAICNTDNSPICRCLNGFAPKSQQAWEEQDWSSGCARNLESDCQEGVTFVKVSGVKMPDLLQFHLKSNMSLSECEAECLRNCSCKAYTNPYINLCNTSCLMWYGNLIDTRGYGEEVNEQNIYIRVPVSELSNMSGTGKKKKIPVLLVSLSTASAILIAGLICGWIILKRRVMRKKELKMKKADFELPLFDFATIAATTNNFSKANMLGEGGFGPVYKGKLLTGQEVAVKRLSKTSGQGIEEFKNEVILIAKLQHRNLVRLLGCCIQGEERMLIYEYMQNNSLSHFIFEPNRKALLTWPKRFEIIMGIARGLLYLHQDSRLKIIHRDLKTSNILLDNNLVPKISDFGLARIFGGDQAFVKTKRVIGTYGYMAPEYAVDGKFSVKSDVFSMGVLILEIVSGKKNRSFSHPDHHHNLLGHAWLLWNENRALDLMEACLQDSFVECQVKRCIQVGLLCVQKLAEDRPTMSSVMFKLGNEEATLPRPKQPGFFIERSSSHEEMSTSASDEGSNQDILTLTITELEAR